MLSRPKACARTVSQFLSIAVTLSKVSLGKQWHEPRSAFRPKAGNGTYEKRLEERKAMSAVKAKEKEMKEEKEAERQVSSMTWSANMI